MAEKPPKSSGLSFPMLMAIALPGFALAFWLLSRDQVFPALITIVVAMVTVFTVATLAEKRQAPKDE